MKITIGANLSGPSFGAAANTRENAVAAANRFLRDLVINSGQVEGTEPELIVVLIVLARRIGLIVNPGDEIRNA